MVYYKALNYLQHAVNHKQQFLSKSLLTEPHHLEHVENYIHSGRLLDSCFQKPWERATIDEIFLQSQTKDARLDFEVKKLSCSTSDDINNIEKFDSEDTSPDHIQHGYFDLLELARSPSPPTNYQELHTSSKCSEEECNKKEDLKKLRVEDYWMIEEPLLKNVLLDITKGLPTLKALKCRLHGKQVQDPLTLNKSSMEFLLNKFQKIENIDDNEITLTQDKQISSCLKDECNKYDLKEAQRFLEDCISPCHQDTKDTIDVSWKSLIAAEDDTDMSILSTDAIVKETVYRFSQQNFGHHTKLESIHMSSQEDKKTSFLEMNEIGVSEEEFNTQPLLDTPITVNSSSEVAVNLDCTQTLKMLPDMGLCKLDEENDYKLLNKDQSMKLHLQMWQYDRFFDDITSLRFPEPEIEVHYPLNINTQDVRKQIGLKPDDDLGKVELLLSWDIANFTKYLPFTSSMEMLDGTHKGPIAVKESTECFSKFDAVVVHDIDDKLETGQEKKSDKKDFRDTEKRCGTLVLRNNFGMDPLNDFMTMRGSELTTVISTSRETFCHPVQAIDSIFVESPSMSESDLNIERHVTKHVSPQATRKTWINKTITVQVAGDFEEALKLLEDTASYYMTALSHTGKILPSCTFSLLTPDKTRFLIKQMEKRLEDENVDVGSSDSLKAVVALHTLCGACELLKNCCLESALGYMIAMQQKYCQVLNDCLSDCQRKLWSLQCKFHEHRSFHPKLIALYKEIEFTASKTSDDVDTKVLIITKRNLPSLCQCLKQFLTDGSNFKADILEDVTSENIIKSLDNCSCLIAARNQVSNNFPWSHFSLVIEYEKEDNSTMIKDLCQSQNIAYATLEISKAEVFSSAEDGISVKSPEIHSRQTKTMFGSRHLISNQDLLQILETRYNLNVLERSYEQEDTSSDLEFADLIVDEMTCVVLHALRGFTEIYQLDPLISKILALSLKFTTSWIIFYTDRREKKCTFNGSFVRNISKLHAALSNFITSHTDLEIKILTCGSMEETATIIHSISNSCEEKAKKWKPNDWSNRDWITEHVLSKDEQLLHCFPCLNPLSAQRMLQQMPLNKLLRSAYKQLVSEFPWMSKRSLKIFCQQANSDKGLQLRSNTSNTSTDSLLNSRLSENNDIKNISTESLRRIPVSNSNECPILSKEIDNSDIFSRFKIKPQSFGQNKQDNYFHVMDKQPHFTAQNTCCKDIYFQDLYGEKSKPNFENFFKDELSSYPQQLPSSFDVSVHDVSMQGEYKSQLCKQDSENDLSLNDQQVLKKRGKCANFKVTPQQDTNFKFNNMNDISPLFEKENSQASCSSNHLFHNIDGQDCFQNSNSCCEQPLYNFKKRNLIKPVSGNTPRSCTDTQFTFEDNFLSQNENEYSTIDERKAYSTLTQDINHLHTTPPYRNMNFKQSDNSVEYFANKEQFINLHSMQLLNHRMRRELDRSNGTSWQFDISKSNGLPDSNVHVVYPGTNYRQETRNSNYCNRDFTKALSQTTQNILRQSMRQDNHIFQGSKSLHRISIGLAQPLRREGSIQKDNAGNRQISPSSQTPVHTSSDVKILESNPTTLDNLQNMTTWDGYDSPPMDLDLSDSFGSSTQNNEEECKREKMKKVEKRSVLQRSNKKHSMVGAKIPLGSLNIFNHQFEENKGHTSLFPPKKKKKLTYHMVPGVKGGQTKLVFK